MDKSKIIATLGPAISSTSQLKKIIELGVMLSELILVMILET